MGSVKVPALTVVYWLSGVGSAYAANASVFVDKIVNIFFCSNVVYWLSGGGSA